MKRASITALTGSLIAAAIVAAPALARNPYSFNPNIYNGGMSYNPLSAYNGAGALGYLNSNSTALDQRKNNLAMRINQSLASGRLRPNEARKLTNDLNRVSTREAGYLNRNRGRLTAIEQVRLNADLAGISLRLDKDLATNHIW